MAWQRSMIVFWGFILSVTFSLPLNGSIEEVCEKINQRARESQTDVILIMHRGHLIYVYGGEKRFEPIDTRSVTKSMLCLAIGFLIQENKICSIDVPVFEFFPEWNQGYKKEITIRHLLNNTSGLMVDETGMEVYHTPDTIRLALAADLQNYPGTHFFYNNKAVNLLAGVIERASGMRVQEYIRHRIFEPMGIVSDTWLCDPSGNNYGMSHLTLNALDLAKIGLLLANEGFWNGKRLLAKEWIQHLIEPSQNLNPFYGLLWWINYQSLDAFWDQPLLALYMKEGVSAQFIQNLEDLNGQVLSLSGPVNFGNFYEKCSSQLAGVFEDKNKVYQFFNQLEKKGLPLARWNEGRLRSYSARGFLGQQLIVIPENSMVAVKLSKTCGQCGSSLDTFADFESLLEELIQQMLLGPISLHP